MCSGMSRKPQTSTPLQELQALHTQLANSPVYIEHWAVPNAIGKVTKNDLGWSQPLV
jgi:hypothetical protein